MSKLKIGITIGDVNGIGPEVIIKALAQPAILDRCTPVIYGSSKVMAYHKNIVKQSNINFLSISSGERAQSGKINVVNCWEDNVNITLGEITADGGKYAHIALDRAVTEIKQGFVDALVTAPINKKAMQESAFKYPGHTEYLADQFEVQESLMMMVSDDLRVALVTNHVPVLQLGQHLNKQKVQNKIKLLLSTLKDDFAIEKPHIAVLGLNPHAGDGGAIGSEEEEYIKPIIIDLKKRGNLVAGPYPADGFFGSGTQKKVQAILAMYHDQGLIPFKALSFGSGVNFTAGLPIVRTSPDHGTGFDIAGKNLADAGSMRSAIYLAMDIARNRKERSKLLENKMKKPKQTESVKE